MELTEMGMMKLPPNVSGWRPHEIMFVKCLWYVKHYITVNYHRHGNDDPGFFASYP